MPQPEDVVFPRRRERTADRRKEGEHRKVLDEFFDHPTLIALSTLISRGVIDAVDFPIATGKEGGVFRATKGEEFRAVKIYRVGNTTFRHLPAYALEDLRREASVRNFGGLVIAWTRREHTTLGRLVDAGVHAPRPYAHLRNVLVMQFLGSAEGAAPRLKDALIEEPEQLYEALVEEIRRMVVGAKLVHGDLSPYNTLYWEEKPWLIDVAQAVSREHPQARALLERDIGNFAKFLRSEGADVDAAEFLERVGGDQVGPRAREA
ncbi:MAG TPA: serine protein kinase RIO [Thermoplasmata archaeon]|nr:serine protein kinase RIO [Thermoplasmata archaeon]